MTIVVDDIDKGKRTLLGLLEENDLRDHRVKVNDLYLEMEEVRWLALGEKVAPILKNLLGHTPTLCNSLYLVRGSTQPAHVDAIYMTPRTHTHLIATWVALEDAHEDAGQLEYYPGSHKIEQMKFSTGLYNSIPEEMPAWAEYMAAEVERLGLQKQQFAAKKGDLFIWHAHLLHGGGPIRDMSRTRKSLVFHYFSEEDARRGRYSLQAFGDSYWIKRPPQALPGQDRVRSFARSVRNSMLKGLNRIRS